MEELVKTISASLIELDKNLGDSAKGNKAAGRRARKNTLELEKMFKEFRKKSVEAEKA